MIAEAALNQCWAAFPHSQNLSSPSKTKDFDVVKRDDTNMEITTEGQSSIVVPKEAFVKVLSHMITNGHVRDKPCEVGNNYSAPGPLADAATVNGKHTIHYILPILQAMRLVEINSNKPNTTWLS